MTHLKISSSLGNQMNALAKTLDDYNNSRLAGCSF